MIDFETLSEEVQIELNILNEKQRDNPDSKLQIQEKETPILYPYLMKSYRDQIQWHRSKKTETRRCYECNEYFSTEEKDRYGNKMITHEQYHEDKNCPIYDWLEYMCGCDNIRKEIHEKYKLDNEEKQDAYYDNQPDCKCKKKVYHWICEECRINGC